MKRTKVKAAAQPVSDRNDDFEEFDFFGMGKPEEKDESAYVVPKNEYSPFDFIGSASMTKVDLVKNAERPEEVEKQYTAFIVNRGFSYFEDTILHANEMNTRPVLFKDAQYRYFLGILRPRKRFSKWHKAEKSTDLDAIQQYFQCNRTVAKYYTKVLTAENMMEINTKVNKGGS